MSTDHSRIKRFKWDSEELAKAEFAEWNHQLLELLSVEGIIYCLDADNIEAYRPIHPGPQPAPTAAVEARREWQKAFVAHHDQQLKFLKDFDKAIGLLRATLSFTSKAAADLEVAVTTRPADVPQDQWNSERKFRAAYAKLSSTYAPKSSTDVTALRRELQELNDDAGFYKYAADFTRIHLQLIQADNQGPSVAELRDFCRKSIRNPDVVKRISNLFPFGITQDQMPTQERIFNEIRAYLMFCGEAADPYKLAYSSPGKPAITSPTAAAAGTDRNPPVRCTRCWGHGHRYNLPCKAFKCTQCNTKLTSSDFFCPNYANHTEKGTNWAPRHLVNPKTPPSGANAQPVTPSPSSDTVKQARKALKVALKAEREAKRQKTTGK
jgi:hypothetical protein